MDCTNSRQCDPGGCLVEVITYIEGNDHWQLGGPGDSLLGTLDDADMPLGGTQIGEDVPRYFAGVDTVTIFTFSFISF